MHVLRRVLIYLELRKLTSTFHTTGSFMLTQNPTLSRNGPKTLGVCQLKDKLANKQRCLREISLNKSPAVTELKTSPQIQRVKKIQGSKKSKPQVIKREQLELCEFSPLRVRKHTSQTTQTQTQTFDDLDFENQDPQLSQQIKFYDASDYNDSKSSSLTPTMLQPMCQDLKNGDYQEHDQKQGMINNQIPLKKRKQSCYSLSEYIEKQRSFQSTPATQPSSPRGQQDDQFDL